jgi:tetratricopeptide (TPR) repeat protein
VIGDQVLREQFPGMTQGDVCHAFIVSSSKDMEQFAVLVIRIDHFEKRLQALGEQITVEIVVSLAKILAGMGKTRTVAWGRLDQEHFACLCPDLDEAGAVAFGKELQRRFSLHKEDTVSVGLAVYPFWPFEKDSILSNAQKALDHAAFFGANTITPFDAVSLNISADKLYQYGDMDGAIEEFSKALMVDAENTNVHNSLGVCYGVQGRFDPAIDCFETAIRLNPKDVMATYNLGLAHLKKGDRGKALKLFLSAHDLDGSHPDIACHIGMCYQEMGEIDKAIFYLEQAAEKGPKGPHAFRALGECYLAKEKPHDACKAYEKAIKKHPTDAKSLSALGHLYGRLGENLEIAIVLARESTAIEPENGLYRCRLGELYLRHAEPEKAVEQLEKAAGLGEDCGPLLEKAKQAMARAGTS